MSGTGPRLRYRTPADIRAIPNERWEDWLRTGTLPFQVFPAERSCQLTLRWIVKATRRRVGHGTVTSPPVNDTTRET